MRAAGRTCLSPKTWARIAADAMMVNGAWASALVVRFIFEIGIQGNGPPQNVLMEYVDEYVASVWLLTLISVVVFYGSGFYTRGRYYEGHYKALVVAQGVSLSYLIFGFVSFFLRVGVSLPRSVLFIGWFLTCAELIVARLWTMIWRAIDDREPAAHGPNITRQGTRRVLVIGGAGFIGSALLPKLLQRGYEVRLFDLLLFGKEPIANLAGYSNLEIIQGDFRHMDKVVRAMKGVDDVIHLGAIVGDQACSLDEELTIEVNLIATRMVAEVAKGSGIKRFYFASTCSVFGSNEETLDERSVVNPLSLYARSKLASERVLMPLASDVFSPVILRFGTVYGLSGRTRFDLVVNLLTAKALADGKLYVFGADQWRPFVHVDDAALALTNAVEAPIELIHNQVFNVGSNAQNYQLRDVAQIIRSLVPGTVVTEQEAGADFRNYRVDFTKIARVLEFVPQWTLEQGVTQVIAALKRGEVPDYRHPMYSNVTFLSEEHNSNLMRREMGWAVDLMNIKTVPLDTGSTVSAAS
ncbi:MAG: UDP-glucose 4-epimerase [Nitrospira sp.]|nr:MAG: UDP-glucose 4-epimerase [Nitrospira sp.]